MASENRIPRVRIHEDNFAEEIKNPPYPEHWGDEWKKHPREYLLEVVNTNNEVIALFYQILPFVRTDFYNTIDYAKYYDTLIIHRIVAEDCIHFQGKNGLIDAKTSKVMMQQEYNYWKDYRPSGYDIGIISYVRLKYPLGLEKKHQEKYRQVFSLQNEYIYDTIDFHRGGWAYYPWQRGGTGLDNIWWQQYERYPDDPVDYLNFSLNAIMAQVTRKNFNELITCFIVDDYLAMGLQVIKGIADNLFTEENITAFIDQARKWEIKDIQDFFCATYKLEMKEILDFLLDYKRKHFTNAEHSLDIRLFGIGRIKFLETDSPHRMPSGKHDFFLELINSEGITKALIFNVESLSFEYLGLLDLEEWDILIGRYDHWLEPNFRWKDIEAQRWLLNFVGMDAYQEIFERYELLDVSDLDYDNLPDGLLDDLYSDEESYVEGIRTFLPAIFLLVYGRLKYPYNLTKEDYDNCEIYIRGFVKRRNLIGEFTELTKDPKDIAEIFNFCKDVFPDEESFREAYINQKNIKELVLCDLEIFMAIADSVLSKENIDLFLDEAHAEHKIELKLFLLDYKNKHFLVDTKLEYPSQAGKKPSTGVSGKYKSPKHVDSPKLEIIVPQGYTYINEFAFRYHRGVKIIILPESISEIDGRAFMHCVKLEEINLGSQIAEIKAETFNNCQSLKKIIIPGNIKIIGVEAFWGCSSLEEVDLQEGLESINDRAFSNCPNLKQIKMPASMKEISLNAFDYSGITEFDINSENPIFTIKDGALYKKETDQLIISPPGRRSL